MVEPHIGQPLGMLKTLSLAAVGNGRPPSTLIRHIQGTASSDMSAHIRHMAAVCAFEAFLTSRETKRFTCSVSFEPARRGLKDLRNGPTLLMGRSTLALKDFRTTRLEANSNQIHQQNGNRNPSGSKTWKLIIPSKSFPYQNLH